MNRAVLAAAALFCLTPLSGAQALLSPNGVAIDAARNHPDAWELREGRTPNDQNVRHRRSGLVCPAIAHDFYLAEVRTAAGGEHGCSYAHVGTADGFSIWATPADHRDAMAVARAGADADQAHGARVGVVTTASIGSCTAATYAESTVAAGYALAGSAIATTRGDIAFHIGTHAVGATLAAAEARIPYLEANAKLMLATALPCGAP